MAMTGGKLKEIQVTLLLSSRAEMQKVIEKARQTSMNLFQLPTPTASTQVVEPKMAKINIGNIKTNHQMPDNSSHMPQVPQPPIISLTSFLAQTMQQKPSPQTVNTFTSYKSQMGKSTEIPGLGFSTTSHPNQFLESNAYSALFNSSNDFNKVHNNGAYDFKKKELVNTSVYSSSLSSNPSYDVPGRRERSCSRDLSKNSIRSRRSRSRSRDKYKTRDRSAEKRSRSSSRERRDRRQKRSRFSDAETKPLVSKIFFQFILLLRIMKNNEILYYVILYYRL